MNRLKRQNQTKRFSEYVRGRYHGSESRDQYCKTALLKLSFKHKLVWYGLGFEACSKIESDKLRLGRKY